MVDDGVKISALNEILTEPATGEMAAVVSGGVTYKRDIGKRLPSTAQKSALAGYGNAPSATNPYATQTGATTIATNLATPLSDLNRVFQLNGNGIPTFPDNVAGATNYWKNFRSVPSGWIAQSSPTSSFSNGVWNISGSGLGLGYYTSFAPAAGLLIRIRIRVITGSVSVGIYSYSQITITNTNWLNYDFIGNGINAFLLAGTGGAAEYKISDIYIGSGLYDTPVYDKACCNRATNYGVLPVKGPRGQSLSFNGGQSLQFDNPVIGTTGTIAFKLKDVPSGVICWNESYNSNGICIFYTSGVLLVRFSYSGGNIQLEATVSSTGSFVLTFVNGDIKLYRDTMIIATSTFANITVGSNNLKIGREASGSYLTGVISDFRYDSRIWTQDDVTRYHNGDDAVDSQQKAITNVPNAIKICDSKGNIRQPGLPVYADNTAALVGGLVVGEPYRTSTGVLMVVF